MRAFLKSTLMALACSANLKAGALFEFPVDRAGGTWTAVRGAASADGQVYFKTQKSLRVFSSQGTPDACIQSASVNLTVGKTYELSGWVRTDEVVVRG
jgi:hypothetical protein